MIKSKDVNKELKTIDDNAKIKSNDTSEVKLIKSILKAVGLLVKLIRDIKTNQATIMEHNKIPLVKDKSKREEKE